VLSRKEIRALTKLENFTAMKLNPINPTQIKEVVNRVITYNPVDVVLNNSCYRLVNVLQQTKLMILMVQY